MRILSIYYTHKPGGFCKRLYRLLSAAVVSGDEVHYLTLDPPPSNLHSEVKIHLIPFPLQQRAGLFFWALFTCWAPLYALWRSLKLKPECYLAFGAYYARVFKLAKLFRPAPLILFLRALSHKIDLITGKNSLIRNIAAQFDKSGMRVADRIVCMSKAMKDELEQFLGSSLSDCVVLSNDVPKVKKSLTVLRDAPIQSKFIVLTAGVIDQRKNIEFLLYAFSALEKDHGTTASEICLLIAGDGPLFEQSLELAKELELESVRFLGWTDELEYIYRSSSLLVHPSLHEGVPNTVLEALAYDLPILVSDIPELRELVKYPELTFDLLEPQLLAEKIYNLSIDINKLNQLRGLSAKRKAALSFDWDAQALSILKI